MKKSTSPGVKKPSSRPRRGRLKFMPHVAAIIDSVTDAIIAVNEEQRVVLFNPAAEKMFGYAVQAAIGQPLDRFIPERFHAAHWAHVRAFGPSGKTARTMGTLGTVSGIRADGQEFPIEASISQTEIDGHKLYTVVLRDVTERKTIAERDASRTHTLQRLSELGLMLSGVPEDIFRHVVRMIGELFAVRVVCLSEIVGCDLLFKAVYVDGEVCSDAGGCPIIVTPCATVEVTKDLRVYDRVAERFPQASFLRDHKAYAYCGFPSVDGAGRVVAVTCLLDDKPREFSDEDREILRLIGQRVAVEVERERHISERKQAEAALRDSAARLNEAQRIAQVGSWELDLATSALSWSDEIFRIFEIDPAKFGASYEAFLNAIHPGDRDMVNAAYTLSVQTRRPYEIIHRLLMADGRIKFVQEHCETYYDGATGRPLRSVGTVQDITALKQAEAKIEASLREKETLLREVHHRVKNNLQIISSLLHFQSKKAQHEMELTALREGQDRLRAMILVHEHLYRSTDLHSINLGDYIGTLTDQLRRSFREAAGRLHLGVEAEAVLVPVEIALPCGMIVTELVTNAFKYAYPADGSGPVSVCIAKRESSFVLSVSDSGAGLPAGFDLSRARSFGLQLAANLADQLGATLARVPGTGTVLSIEVPVSAWPAAPERPSATEPQLLRQPGSL